MDNPPKIPLKNLALTVVYDNNPYRQSLQTAWGFSCVIEGAEKTILFDTGGDGEMLLSNMRKLGIDPFEIDVIVLSHGHSDHVGGLAGFLRCNPDVTIYLPRSFPGDFKEKLGGQGATVIEVSAPLEIFAGVYSTGELGTHVSEQSLVIVTDDGSIVLTGCAHPGIVRIVERAEKMTSSAVNLVMGGFHLSGETRQGIDEVISRLRALKVKHVGPCHCSGDMARELFRRAWGENYLDVGVGRVIRGETQKPTISPFEDFHDRYEAWFIRHHAAYWAELLAVRALVPWTGLGLEIGVGSGRFAAPLGVRVGFDPSAAMLAHAARRGIAVVRSVAEAMPFRAGIFDFALNVTTICFLEDVKAAMAETHRVLKPGGKIIIGFIDRTSALGKEYETHKFENVFYQAATFFSAEEVACLLRDTGFSEQVWLQTLSRPLNQIREPEPVQPGSGRGAFLAVLATRSSPLTG